MSIEVNQDTPTVWITLGTLSMIMLICTAGLMYNQPKLMRHPNLLIFGMCIAEAFSNWHAVLHVVGVDKMVSFFDM
jgi:hypothetical protein